MNLKNRNCLKNRFIANTTFKITKLPSQIPSFSFFGIGIFNIKKKHAEAVFDVKAKACIRQNGHSK